MPRFQIVLLAITLCVTPAMAGVLVDVIPAFGPSDDSDSKEGFFLNAMKELRDPGSSAAHRADNPAGYQSVPSGANPYGEVFSSIGFNSWRGKAAPTPGWEDGILTPDAFSTEYGTAVYFGARILVDDPLNDNIRLADLFGQIHWEEDNGIGGYDPSSVLTGNLAVDFSSWGYDFAIVGVDFGEDGSPGGSDDRVYDSPFFSNTIPVDALYLVGLADTVWVSSFGKPTSQEDLDEAVRQLDALPAQLLTASYTIASVNDPGNPATGAGEVLFSYDAGDYDRDGDVDLDDFDVWTLEYGVDGSWRADGNHDGFVNTADFNVWRDSFAGYDAGDYDRDGNVDLDDYDVWTLEYGVDGSWRADGNNDGVVDTADFNVWRDTYARVPRTASVPEPNGAVILWLGVTVFPWFGLARWRRGAAGNPPA